MDNPYQEPIRRPRTIDVLETNDCVEIIMNDLARYGVPEALTVELITNYFAPLKNEINKLKKNPAIFAMPNRRITYFLTKIKNPHHKKVAHRYKTKAGCSYPTSGLIHLFV